MRKVFASAALLLVGVGGYAAGQANDAPIAEYDKALTSVQKAEEALSQSYGDDMPSAAGKLYEARERMAAAYTKAALNPSVTEHIVNRNVGNEKVREIDLLSIAQNSALIEQNRRIESLLQKIANKK